MKKIYFLVTSLLLLTGFAAQSQCTNGSAFGTFTAPTNNTVMAMSTCIFGGEYNTINGAVAGQTYQFTASGGTGNYLTVHQGTPGGTVLGSGFTPLTVTVTVSGPIYLHVNTTAACGTDGTCHSTFIQCTSCPAGPTPCTSIVNIPACATTVTTAHTGAGAGWSPGNCGFTTPGSENIFTFTPAATGSYNLVVTSVPVGGFLDYFFKPVSAGCGPTGWTCIDDISAAGTFPIGTLTGGTQYYILVDDETTAATTHTFQISCALADPCTGPITNIPACATNITSTHTGAGSWSVTACGFSTPGQEKLYTFTPTVTGLYNLNVVTATGGFVDYFYKTVASGCGSAGWICIDDNSAAGTDPIGVLTAGTQYYILLDPEGTGSFTHTFNISCALIPPPNDLCTGAITINCGQTINGNTSTGATIDATAPTCVTGLNTAPGMWYTFVGDGSIVTLSLCGSGYDTKIGVYTGTCAAPVCVTGNDDFAGCGLQSQVTFNTVAGTTYNILVTGFLTASGPFTLTRTCSCTGVPSPGSISGPAATICRNVPVTLTLSGYTSGVTGLTFQWNTAPAAGGPYTQIPGATGTTYAFTSSATAYYTVTVTCTAGGGNATTAPFLVTVDGIAHTAVSATPSTVCAGGSTAITATAINGITAAGLGTIGSSGTINLPIPDANPTGASNTIAIPALTIPNANSLRVVINVNHTWVGDLAFELTSPCGTTFLFDRPGVPASTFGNADDLAGTYTFDVAAAAIIPEAAVAGTVPPGSYRPSDAGGAANLTWAPVAFPCAAGGNWTIRAIDGAGGDVGTLVSWSIIGPTPGNYTHTLTGGPGTITQNPSTGPSNATGNFTVTNLPAGNHTYTFTSTDPFGCSVSTPVNVTVNALPTIVFTPASATICNGQIQQINVYAAPGTPQTFSSNSPVNIPGTGTVGNGNPYPAVLNIAGLPVAGVTVRSVQINNFNHTFPDDVDIVLVNPSGAQQVIIMSDAGGGTLATGQNFSFSDSYAASLADAAFNATGNYKPSNYTPNPDVFPAPGPGSLNQGVNPLLSTFSGDPNGDWKLYAVDDVGGDAGLIGSWSITFNVPAPVILTQSPASPNTIFTNAAATIPYVPGTPVYTVWVNPTTTTTYTGNATVLGCSALPTNMVVTVNQLPAITTQPAPATQTICPGFTVSYSVVATGTGPLTYQWQFNNGSGFVNLTNGGFISGATSSTLTIANVQQVNAGSYRVIVSGACTPAATSNSVVLNVGSAPTITTQPVNTTVCEGSNATLSVVVGGTPPPTIFQWQVSTDAGATWTNLTTGGSYTTTLTLTNVALTMNNNRYRVIVTNACGMTITSNAVTLTVNARPVVTATPLPARICLSDTLVPLVGSPTGGSWSGIGVSGFNFVPTATAVGTYTLTYTFTSAAGCTNTTSVVAKVEDCPERIRLLSQDGVLLYPNPNNGRFNIRINSVLYNYLGMKVYDMAGRLVNGKVVKDGYNQALVSPVFTGLVYGRVIPVDLSYLPAGTYLVKLYYDDGIRSSEKGFMVVIIK